MCKKTTAIQFRIDAELKEAAEKVFDQLGLTFSSAYTMFTKAVVNQGRIPFEIGLPEKANYPYTNCEKKLITLNE